MNPHPSEHGRRQPTTGFTVISYAECYGHPRNWQVALVFSPATVR
jgi:hypothetical protein